MRDTMRYREITLAGSRSASGTGPSTAASHWAGGPALSLCHGGPLGAVIHDRAIPRGLGAVQLNSALRE